MSRRPIVLLLLSLALAACVPATPGMPPATVPDLTVAVTPAQGEEDEASGHAVPPTEMASDAPYVPGEFVVGLSSDADLSAIARSVGASVKGEVRFSGRYAHLALSDGASLAEEEARLHAQAGVSSVAPNWLFQPSYLASNQSPDDRRYADQWAHRVTSALPAWRALGTDFSASSVAIAVVDSGCDVGHPDLAGRFLPGRNFTDEHPDTSLPQDLDVTDLHGHGTHVAGIAAASGRNAVGIAGVAWDARLVPIKVLTKTGGTFSAILQGIQFAADYQSAEATVRVINLSLGLTGHFQTEAALDDAMAYAWRKGIAVVVASGNEATPPNQPASNPHALVVSATGLYQVLPGVLVEMLAGFSNRGDRIDVSAPGDDILSTVPRNDNTISKNNGLVTRPVGDETSVIDEPYAYANGTSMAAPYVSGLAALLVARYDPYHLQLNGAFTDRLVDRIESTADDLGPIGKDPYFGYGRVNVQKALAPSTL